VLVNLRVLNCFTSKLVGLRACCLLLLFVYLSVGEFKGFKLFYFKACWSKSMLSFVVVCVS
jgi:hypothetical protein